MSEASVSKFTEASGLNIAYRTWKPSGDARAALVIVPGFNAHSGRYLAAGAQLAASGYAVYAIDLRGRGLSDGERFYVDSIDDYVSDVHGLMAIVKASEPGKKIFLFGHSAGGVVATTYALDHQADLAGLIAQSFAYKVPAPDFAIAALKGLSHLAPHAHVLALNNKDFSRDPAVVESMNNDPLIAHETQPTKTVASLAKADDRLGRSFGSITTLPVLIQHGTADAATKPAGSQEFFDKTGSGDKHLKFYEGHVHDLLNDVGHETVLADITAWLDARA